MLDDLAAGVKGMFAGRPWYELPKLLGMRRLLALRDELRQKNLYDTEEPALATDAPAAYADHRARSIDGICNDLSCRSMGAAGRRFGRNVPLEHTYPDVARLLVPNPRLVSRELMTRDAFVPAESLNLLAAAWIQFMVHDWFVHEHSRDSFEIPTPDDPAWGAPVMRIPRTKPDPAPPGSTRPPAYANMNSHWWDASQIYGCSAEAAARLRTRSGGTLHVDANGFLPIDPATGLHLSGFTENWWIGLAMLHTLFTLEHNYICDRLAKEYPEWDDQRLFCTAQLINAALMAKIHTVEWTPAILPHPVVRIAMRTNWEGLAGEEAQELIELLNRSELLGGIVGSGQDHHGVPYSLTEEFVAVYRMHPLIPDDFAFHSQVTGALLERRTLHDISGRRVAALANRITPVDLFYSFGTCHPGAITLHNYPHHLQHLTRDDGERLDLAAVDILRDRERGVPRYNQFRRLMHKPPVTSFDELTDNPEWRRQIRAVYENDLEQVDLMTGLFAEPLPEGFGFSETAFRVFVLMASRRLKSDRFFTDDYRAEVYTDFGLDHVRRNTMTDVLLRHYPSLAPSLKNVGNAFHPWNAAATE